MVPGLNIGSEDGRFNSFLTEMYSKQDTRTVRPIPPTARSFERVSYNRTANPALRAILQVFLPQGPFRTIWDVITMSLVIYTAIALPLQLCYFPYECACFARRGWV